MYELGISGSGWERLGFVSAVHATGEGRPALRSVRVGRWRALLTGAKSRLMVSSTPKAIVGSVGIGGLTLYGLRSNPTWALLLAMLCALWSYLVLKWIVFASSYVQSLKNPEELGDRDSRFGEVDGVQLHYKRFDPYGAEFSGTDGVVLFHGFGASLFSFDNIAQSLADIFGSPVVSFDVPGFGLTQRPADYSKYSFRTIANLGLALSEDQGMDSVILCGHSMGGLAACLAAIAKPERVRGLILIAPAVIPASSVVNKISSFRIMRALIKAFLLVWSIFVRALWYLLIPVLIAILRSQVSTKEFWRVLLEYAFYDVNNVRADVIKAYSHPNQAKQWDIGVLRFVWEKLGASRQTMFEQFEFGPAHSHLESMSFPTLIVHGEQDPIISARIGSHAAERIPDARFVLIPGCGHVPHEELPEDFLRCVKSFVVDLNV